MPSKRDFFCSGTGWVASKITLWVLNDVEVLFRMKAKQIGSRNVLFVNYDEEKGEMCLVVNKLKGRELKMKER